MSVDYDNIVLDKVIPEIWQHADITKVAESYEAIDQTPFVGKINLSHILRLISNNNKRHDRKTFLSQTAQHI